MTYPLFETLCLENGEVKNTLFHQLRLDWTFKKLFNKKAPIIEKILSFYSFPSKGLYRLRLNYNEKNYLLEIFPYQRKEYRTFKPIICDEINYSFKWKEREKLNQLVKQKAHFDEIIIIKKGFITDSSIGNLIFRSQNSWYTPEHPLLKGTQRERLLMEKKIIKANLHINDLCQFEEIRLINAMNRGL